jgi:hypothetical protein
MLTLNCPSCHRPLTVRDELAGAWLMCPGCKAKFQAVGTSRLAASAPPPLPSLAPIARPAPPDPVAGTSGAEFDVVPIAPPVALPVAPPLIPPVPRGTASPAPAFDFGESATAKMQRVRVHANIGATASWLYLEIFAAFAMSFIVIISPAALTNRANEIATGYLILIVCIVIYAPLVFVGLGMNALHKQSSFSLAMIGAVAALFVALVNLVPLLASTLLLLAGLQAIVGLGAGGIGFGAFFFGSVIFLISGFAVFSGCMGGIKTFIVLGKDEVKAAFR